MLTGRQGFGWAESSDIQLNAADEIKQMRVRRD